MINSSIKWSYRKVRVGICFVGFEALNEGYPLYNLVYIVLSPGENGPEKG